MKVIKLVTDSPIIIKIFSLLAVKLNFDLRILTNFESDLQSDILIIDENFVDDNFHFLKRHTKLLGTVNSKDSTFGKTKDFEILKPFLPSQVEAILIQNFEKLAFLKPSEEKTISQNDTQSNKNTTIKDESSVTIADDTYEIGILDKQELEKIKMLLKEDDEAVVYEHEQQEEWDDDLSNLIDSLIEDATHKLQKRKKEIK